MDPTGTTADHQTGALLGPKLPGPGWRNLEVLLALVFLVAVYALVTSGLRLGPIWLLPALVGLLLVPLVVAHRRGRHDLARIFAFMVAGVGTAAVQGSAIVLVVRLLRGSVLPTNLLRDAALLWVANVVIFSLWYWQLDGGGPYHRHHYGYRPTDLAFPQTTLGRVFTKNWMPGYVDYLFVSFNASAAFSPTDTLFLSVRVKLLMMVQAMVSIVILAVVAARAINILH